MHLFAVANASYNTFTTNTLKDTLP